MSSLTAPNRSRQRLLRLLFVLFLLSALLPLSAYWLSPLWMPALLTRLAQSQGVEAQQLELKRPTGNRWQIDRAALLQAGLRIELRDVTVDYHWRHLLAGRVHKVSVGALAVHVSATPNGGVQDPEPQQSPHPELPEPAVPAYWLRRLPWQSLEIESLTVALPQHAVHIRGRATQQATRIDLAAQLVAGAPALTRELRLTHDADGQLTLALLDGSARTTALELALRFNAATLDYTLSSALPEADTALLLQQLGYPEANVSVELNLSGQVPWPLPRAFAWRDLAADGRYALGSSAFDAFLRPRSGIEALTLDGLAGRIALARNALTATADSGTLRFSLAGAAGVGRCTIAKTLRLTATRSNLGIGPGIGCLLENDHGTVDLALLDFAARWPDPGRSEAPIGSTLKLEYAATVDGLSPRGELVLEASQAADGTISGSGSVSLAADRLLAADPPGSPVLLPFTAELWPEEGRGELHLDHELSIADRVLAAVNEDWSGSFDLGRARLSYESTLRWHFDELSAAFRGRFAELKVYQMADAPVDTLDLRPLAGTFAGTLAGTALTLTGELQPGALSLPVTFNYDLATGAGRATMNIAETVTAPTFDQLFLNWPQAYALTSGQLSGAFSVALADGAPSRMTSSVKLTGGTVRYRDYQLLGVSTDLELEWLPDRLWATGQRVRVQQVDLGFPVTDLTAALSYEATAAHRWLRFDDLGARLLGGTATAGGFSIDLNAPQNAFTVELSGLALEELVALEGDEVSGTGTLDGRLPIDLQADGVRIQDGDLVSRPPGGVIRLSDRFAAPTGEPGLDFALTALSDFTYSTLLATVDYAPAGDLALSLRLQGQNPKVEQGRPIHYNVNVTENVPALLESLKADRLITDEVERRVNR
ncbi:MAG: YdbH domain-containing protein [Pseudomonadota bacterium]